MTLGAFGTKHFFGTPKMSICDPLKYANFGHGRPPNDFGAFGAKNTLLQILTFLTPKYANFGQGRTF